jgi:molybdenum cofactor cytidylyltransferase
MKGAVSAVILAAGESRRMGVPKLLLPFGGDTIIGCTVRNVVESAVKDVIVVLGSGADAIAARLRGAPVRLVMNADYRKGMLTSALAGIEAVGPDAEAVMLIPGDQPLISTATIDLILAAFRRSKKGIAVPIYRGCKGHPLVFALKYRDELSGFTDEGVRRLLYDHPADVLHVAVDKREVITDIDTPSEYRASASLLHSAGKKTGAG